jgi:membrane fusion protein (multidrug efflux system)
MTKTTIATLALCLAGLLTGCDRDTAEAAKRPPEAALVEATTVQSGTLTRRITAVGSLRSDESVTVTAEVSGRIVTIGFQEGQPVRRGQLLFALDDAVDRAGVAQARAALALAQRNQERGLELFERKLISQQERDTLRAALDSAAAELALAEAQLAKMRISAPFDAVAGLRSVSPGDYVSPGQALVNLESVGDLKIDFRVPELALSQLAVGQALDIRIDAYPQQLFRGEVYAIEPRVADATRSIGLRARLPNPEGQLRSGLSARVVLETASIPDAVLAPEQAIFPRGEQQFVYVIEDGKAVLRPVQVGQREPGRAEIVEGLKPGETLIIAGLQKIGAGSAVRIQPAETPAGGAAGTAAPR